MRKITEFKTVEEIKHWIKAFRLRTLPLSLSCILIGSAIALKEGYFNWLIFALTILTTTLLQVLSNLANDYGDSLKGTDNENRVGPERALQSGKISLNQMKVAIVINAALALISGLLLIYIAFDKKEILIILLFISLGIAAIVAAIKYTMGKNPYGYSGLGDLFVFVFFGLVGVVGTYYLFTNKIDYKIFLPATSIGLLSAAVLNMNNMRDEDNDRACNKNTLVVKIGFEKARVYHTILIVGALISTITLIIVLKLPLLSYLSLMPFIILFKNISTVWKTKIKSELDPELKKIALSTFFIAFIFTITIIINLY